VPKKDAAELLSINGREVGVSNPGKLYFSKQTKLSKLDLVRYYLSVAPGALAGIRDRPLVLKRYVDGSEGEAFYQKRAPVQRPAWLRTITLAFPSGRTAEEIVVDDAAGLAWIVNLGCIELHPHPVRSGDLDHPDELRVDLDPVPGVSWADLRTVALEVKSILDEMGLRGWPKTSGSRGMHINVRIYPRWTFDYNQNAKDRTTCSAYSVRPLPDARVSAPLHWHEVPDCEPSDFTVLTIPKRFLEVGDPQEGIDGAAGSLEKLLELAAQDEAAGLGDAPWPPHFHKREDEPRRVAPSRARSVARKPRTKMPLIVVANSPSKEAAFSGLERWKRKHPDVAKLLAADDVLVDSMRGRSSSWTRIRINLRHVREELRPPQETPDPDDDPTREWRKLRASNKDI
jgi:bifunctional non-homologous end joining protein LigD